MSHPTILQVEDDANDVLLFEQACRKAGLTVPIHRVSDGDEALAYLRGQGPFADRDEHPLPRLVLLDLKMPRVSGFEVLAWLRRQERFRRLPVVVLSSSNHESDVKRALELGVNSYLVKPVQFDALVEVVRQIHQYWLTLDERAVG